jgi:hypothetical protein
MVAGFPSGHVKGPREAEGRPMTPDIMNAPAHYFHAGFILISVANLIVILLMVLVFVLAVLLPFPGGRKTER